MKHLLTLIPILVLLFGCNSSDSLNKEGNVSEENIEYVVADGEYINVKSPNHDNTSTYSKNILIPFEKIYGCDYIVKGKIEYIKDGKVVATLDFGDGQCDNIATKTVDGKEYSYILSGKKESSRYKKNILIPLVKIDSCDYIVEGRIEYQKVGIVVATIDFGNGQCDNIATKTVDGIDYKFKLDKKGKKVKK